MEIDHLSFAYRGDRLVLQDISLDISSRSFVALVGHTGSGKSTLASLMMGYYPLTHGEIRIDGRPLASLSHSALRRGIAMVQQDPVVLADTFLRQRRRWVGISVKNAGLGSAGGGATGGGGAQHERWPVHSAGRAGQ